MRKLMIGGLATVALALGLSGGTASADWVVRTRYVFDPVVGGYVPVTQRVWVPDPVVVVPSYYPSYYYYRPWYYPSSRHEWRERHEHDHHH